jgi:hypothetical protein
VRSIAAILVCAFIAVGGLVFTPSAPADGSAPEATFAAPIYGAGMAPTIPRTTYDGVRQSVYIEDEPAPNPVRPAGYEDQQFQLRDNQQFQILDGQYPAAGTKITYNTIEAPCLPAGECPCDCIDYSCEPWSWQLLPEGLIWHSYLAGPKEPRFEGIIWGASGSDTFLDGMVGGRAGLLRYGNSADFRPQGWQLDVEGAAFIRQDLSENSDVDGYDFRIGFPITYAYDRFMMKLSWYHTSAHLGDEFMLKNPTFTRINYSRNAIVWGLGYYLTDDIRIYGEIDYGYFTDGGNKPWAFQFGWEYSPVVRGPRGAPFVAMNAYLREENDYGGFFTFETGWQWRGARGGQLIRFGFFYQTGPSTLNEFFNRSEQQIGGALWYDF